MSFYASMQGTALSLLTKFGQTVTHTIRTAGTYDPTTGAVTVTETSQSVNVALFDFGAEEIDGMIVIAGDKRAYIASSGVTAPKVDDTLSVGGVVWTIKRVTDTNPAGTSIMYDVQVRK